MLDREEHFYQPSAGHGLKHDPFKSIVGPRPIGWISTVDGYGHRNLAPYSFFNAFNDAPPIIGFASTGWKDSVANIAATGEFAWNLATAELAQAMNASSATVAAEVDEFGLAGLTAAPSRLIGAPRVLESPVNFECRLTQLLQLRDASGSDIETWLVLGEVVAVHIDRRVIRDGIYQVTATRPILRWGGRKDYVTIHPDAMFEMARPIADA